MSAQSFEWVMKFDPPTPDYEYPYMILRGGNPKNEDDRFDVSGIIPERYARMIEAAPDMLAALQAVMAEWREGYGLRCEQQVRAAIATAEGRSIQTAERTE